jgi:ubiquitin-hydrolase Zn-finger-containing protein
MSTEEQKKGYSTRDRRRRLDEHSDRERVEVRYRDGGKTRRFEDDPREEWVAVPFPHPGVEREHAQEALGFRVVAHQDRTLEASWRFGEATLRIGSDTSKNKHATQHFHSTGHPIVRSFQPGEDWRWCYVDEVLF